MVPPTLLCTCQYLLKVLLMSFQSGRTLTPDTTENNQTVAPLPPTGFLHKDTHPTCRYSLCTAFHKHEGLTQVFMLYPQKQILLPTVTWSKCLSVRCGKFPEGMINTLRYWAFIGGRKEVTGKRFGKLTKGENRMRETEFSGKLTLYPELPQSEGTARMWHFHC